MAYAFNWEYQFDKPSYEPGEDAQIRLTVTNTGDVPILVCSVALRTAFGVYSFEIAKVIIEPNHRAAVGTLRAKLPSDRVGSFCLSVEMSVTYATDGQWQPFRQEYWENVSLLNIRPAEVLPVFVSRGVRSEDRAISDPLVSILRDWGLDTRTVGVEILVPSDQVPDRVRQEVLAAPGLILVATPRSLDAITRAWKTFEWAHAEVAMAYAQDRPILVLCEASVEPSGLPSYLESLGLVRCIKFSASDPLATRDAINANMAWFRANVKACQKQMRSSEFWNGMKGVLAFVGGLATAGAIAGMVSGSDDDDDE
ncbi:MAG: hypothetical protein H6839_14685 [Planctomycetes bacterium]|nr:hypothetical protein [Planctomycetota bacterium]